MQKITLKQSNSSRHTDTMQCARCQTPTTLEAISDGLGPLNNNVLNNLMLKYSALKWAKPLLKDNLNR